MAPPIAGTEREQHAERDAERDRGAQQDAARHGLDELEVAQPAWHLHRADRAIHDEQISGRPGHREDEDERL